MKQRRVRETVPVQVYLASDDRLRLERLGHELELTKSDVIRRGLLALEREIHDPAGHPALRLIGVASGELPSTESIDPAREHDRALAEDEEASWIAPPASPRKRKPRGR